MKETKVCCNCGSQNIICTAQISVNSHKIISFQSGREDGDTYCPDCKNVTWPETEKEYNDKCFLSLQSKTGTPIEPVLEKMVKSVLKENYSEKYPLSTNLCCLSFEATNDIYRRLNFIETFNLALEQQRDLEHQEPTEFSVIVKGKGEQMCLIRKDIDLPSMNIPNRNGVYTSTNAFLWNVTDMSKNFEITRFVNMSSIDLPF